MSVYFFQGLSNDPKNVKICIKNYFCVKSSGYDKGVCKHLNYFPNKLKTLRRRFKKKNLDTSLYDDCVSTNFLVFSCDRT